ncbi:MAG: hypothetical protein JNL67_14670 [Planctomycetaceae bacterium]|nr:hypothetical protein [Planctomycetaceae bacterium]
MTGLERALAAGRLPPAQIIGRQLDIYQTMLRSSRAIKHPNFAALQAQDLKAMFHLYDDMFFNGQIDLALANMGSSLTFRLSRRMTSAGGKTTRWHYPKSQHRPPRFEIALSSTLLFESFQNQTPIQVTGLTCHSRLEAMQRVMEHEIIHLCEMLVWFHSSCSAGRFLRIANGLFDHRKSSHELLTPVDKARKDLGIRVGDQVKFSLNGQQLVGTVNRITRRATVLVPHQRGQKYTDGSSYLKFYVPLTQLQRASVG